jgi:hypothetical protein
VGYTRARKKLLVFLEGNDVGPHSPATVAPISEPHFWQDWRNGTFGWTCELTENDRGWAAAYTACFEQPTIAAWEDLVQKASAGALAELCSSARSATVAQVYPRVFHFLEQLLADADMRGWAVAFANELAAEGVGRAATKYNMSLDDPTPPDTSNPEAMADSILFGCLVIPAVVTQLSEKPERGVTKICIPFCLESSMARGAEPVDNPLGREPHVGRFRSPLVAFAH